MKVVVTGGAGFIGANLCRELCGRAEVTEVVAFDNLSTGLEQNLDGTDCSLVEADLLDLDALLDTAAGAHSVVHLAARPSVPRSLADPLASHAANATGTMHVLEAVRRTGVPHVVVASSSSVYGSNPVLPKGEHLKPSPISPYAASKLATEAYALAYAASFDVTAMAFRFFNVFGPLQSAGHAYAAVIPAFLDAAQRDVALPVNGDGTQSRDFTYVGSVANVLATAAIHHLGDGEPVNLAFGSRVTLLELIDEIQAIMGRELRVEHRPPRPGDVPHSQADQSKLRALLPTIEPVPLRDGLQATVDWFAAGCGPLRVG